MQFLLIEDVVPPSIFEQIYAMDCVGFGCVPYKDNGGYVFERPDHIVRYDNFGDYLLRTAKIGEQLIIKLRCYLQ